MFHHELTRDAAYNSILRRRRPEFHRHVGEAIETLFPGRIEDEAHRLAYHFYEARDDERALKYATMAGDAAAHIYANTEAITHYTRAIEVARRGESPNETVIKLYASRGRAMELSGQFDEAISNDRELETLAQERNDRALKLAALIPQATVHSTYTAKFDPERGEALSKQTLALAQEIGDHRAAAKALWNLMLVQNFAGHNPRQAMAYGEQSLAIAREHNLREELAYTLHDLSRAYFAAGQIESAWAALEEAGTMWRELGNMPMLTDYLSASGGAHIEAADFDKAMASATEGLRISESTGNLWGQAANLFVLVNIHLERGEIGECIRTMEDSIVLAKQARFTAAASLVYSVMAWAYGIAGDLDRGFELARMAMAEPDELAGARQFGLGVQAHLHLSSGDAAQASAAIKEAEGGADTEQSDPEPGFMGIYLIVPVIIKGEMALANQEYDRLLTHIDRMVSLMRARRSRIYLADALRLKGQALLGLGRPDEARKVLNEARAEAEAQGSRRAQWPILAALSRLEDQAGNTTEAQTLRQQAHEIIEYMADYTGTPEPRTSFLNTPQVRQVMRTV